MLFRSKGRGVMRGYYQLPEATAEALDGEGYLHTGDIGHVDGGYLRITDRKKDLIKTSGGKYVAPQEIENKLKARSPLLSQVLVHGNNRNFCSALLTINEDGVKSWLHTQGLPAASYAEMARHPKVVEEIGKVVEGLNKELASYESIKKFAILDVDLTLESGDLTPKMSVKRKVVEGKHKAILDGFYEGSLQSL